MNRTSWILLIGGVGSVIYVLKECGKLVQRAHVVGIQEGLRRAGRRVSIDDIEV
jgi:hypothetical protein